MQPDCILMPHGKSLKPAEAILDKNRGIGFRVQGLGIKENHDPEYLTPWD